MTSARPRVLLCLLALFLLALAPRLYSALTLGWHWDHPGSFTLINFDEGGSCRAALKGFEYTPFIGYQTIALASALGNSPPHGGAYASAEQAARSYCHGAPHLRVARVYSAVTGALTPVLLAVIALMLIPQTPGIAWTAGGLLALSGFHISESHSATVDAPSVFFIYLMLALLICAVVQRSRLALAGAALALGPALWAKYWVFAALAPLALTPLRVWRYVSCGFSARRTVAVTVAAALVFSLLSISDFRDAGLYPLLAAFYVVVPWRRIHRPMIAVWLAVPVIAWALCEIDLIHHFTTGGMTGRFGSGYGAIGWHKLPRNLLNLPWVLLVGLGLPACLFIPVGVRAILRSGDRKRGWCCLLPLLAFVLFMAFVSPVTYYRHYLPLLPLAALVAACGLYATRWAQRRWFLLLFFLWPTLLAVDLVADYHRDPRIALRAWYAEHPDARVYTSFYVSPPPGQNTLFRPEYAAGDAAALRSAQYLVLSENWYDTAFANELNGPLTGSPQRLVKTTPEYAAFYRAALAGTHSHLQVERTLAVTNFMPELLLHRWLYGTFQLFVGDIRIFRIVD